MSDQMETPIKILPSAPAVAPFDIQKRIEELHNYLDPKSSNYQPEHQHINIRAVIKLYQEGKIDGVEQVFIKDGKLIPRKEIATGPSAPWIEGLFHQMAQKYSYGHGAFGNNFHEVME